eukprot:7262210-Prymnesium_polylepis.1
MTWWIWAPETPWMPGGAPAGRRKRSRRITVSMSLSSSSGNMSRNTSTSMPLYSAGSSRSIADGSARRSPRGVRG